MDGELLFELPNPKSFWSKVVSDSYVDNGFNTVEYNECVIHQCFCKRLRLQVEFSIAAGGVSNNKTHNRHYQQNFIDRDIRWLEDYLVRKRPEDVEKGEVKFPRINNLFLHKDNASQNLKITGAINFFTHLFK